MQTSDPRINEQVGGKTERVTMLKQNCPRERYKIQDRQEIPDGFRPHRGIQSAKTAPQAPSYLRHFLGFSLSFFFSFF